VFPLANRVGKGIALVNYNLSLLAMDFKNTKNVLPYYIYFFVTIQQMEY